MDFAGCQALGDRSNQEDDWCCERLPDGRGLLAAVADGIGGSPGGEVAAGIAVDHFRQSLLRGNAVEQQPRRSLELALQQANAAIASEIASRPRLAGMGTTLVGVLVTAGHVWWISVGDSHLYRLRDGVPEKLNQDHSLGDSDRSPMRHLLTSCLNGECIQQVDLPHQGRSLRPGDRLILASDGLDSLKPQTLTRIISDRSPGPASAEDTARLLTTAAVAEGRGHQDNVTVVAVHY